MHVNRKVLIERITYINIFIVLKRFDRYVVTIIKHQRKTNMCITLHAKKNN